MNEDSAERLQSIEAHVATLERQVEQLNEVLIEQGRTIMKLQTLLRRAVDTIETLEMDRIKSTNPKPPHYQ